MVYADVAEAMRTSRVKGDMKHVVAVIDACREHRGAVAEALLSFYTVHPYADPTDALSGMLVANPKLILVGQKVGTGSGAVFIKELRKEKCLSRVPVIFVADNEDMRIFDTIRDLGIRHYLVKPYRRSALLNAISSHVNGQVEQSWAALPRLQRTALEGTLQAFNSIADDIGHGQPLPFPAISESCGAVVDVVHAGDLATLLDHIRDHDNFTYVHSLRCAALLCLFGKEIGLAKDQQVVIASGGLLHDIGKMSISRALLNKQGRLTAAELQTLHDHVATAEKVLAATDGLPKGVSTIVAHHHERLDGSGYPHGLAGRQLNQLARMAAIIDVFCALTDRRPYKRSLRSGAALGVMAEDMRDQLDQALLRRFRDTLVAFDPFGEAAVPLH